MACYGSKKYQNGVQDYAYLNDKKIHINDYNTGIITCINGHELIPVYSEKRRKHFRHKNKEDVDNKMSDWHLEWQSKYPNTEISFKKINDQILDRRADVVFNDHIIIEFQHSYISKEEVNNRVHDYQLHSKQVIWIIDGYTCLIKYNNTTFIEFTDDWNYKSFIDQDIILVDIKNKLYKVYPKLVKSNMIDVEEAANETDISINHLKQCTIKIKQQGAGNGKTYGIINKLNSDEFNIYKCYIIVTKQHSAKYIIKQEFEKQKKTLNITNINEIDANKQYKIKYEKDDKSKTLIIGTIDSLFYNLGNKYYKNKDLFQGLVESIIDGYIESINNFKYAGELLKLNKEICLIIDETQDLPRDYGKAIYEIMRSKYVDCYIVGDLLQSIVFEDNAFTYLQNTELSYIETIKETPQNICRRFNNKEIIDFCNNIVDFNKYNLPQINVITNGSGSVTLIKKEKEHKDTIESIMHHYKNEVEKGRKKEDFLIVTPFVKNNELVSMLEIAITKFWVNKLGQEDIYNRYVVFHKSEDGTSIDLNESEYSTRMVSIHTSKGDGRPVVFAIDITESNLKRFSGSINLVYESLLHVAITRQKEDLYFVYQNNNDNVHQRLTNCCTDVEPCVIICKHLNYNKIINSVDELPINSIEFNDNDNQIIDMSHHIIRYACMSMSFLLKACNKGLKENIKKQYYAVLKTVINLPIRQVDTYKEYNNSLIRYDKNKKPINAKEICILKISNGRDYTNYFNIILNIIQIVKDKIQQILNGQNLELKTHELIILFFLVETIEKGHKSDIAIKDLYNIMHIFSDEKNKINGVNKYLINHYKYMEYVNEQFDKFLKNDITWLYQHRIYLNKNSTDYLVFEHIPFIGHDENHVYLIYIKPQFNNLNYLQTMIKATFDTYLIKNAKDIDNYERFGNKTVLTVVFSTKREFYMTTCNLDAGDIIRQKMIDHYIIASKQIQQFYNYNYNKYKHLEPDKIVDYIITNYRSIKNRDNISQQPSFVDKFFNLLEFEMEQDNPNLEKFINYDFTKSITKSIEIFLKT